MIEFFSGIKQCKVFFFATVEALLTDTLVSGKLYLRPPSQKPDYFNSHTNSVFLHSRKRPTPVTDTFFASRGCPLTRASTVPLYALKDFFISVWEFFFHQVFPCKNCFPSKSVCRIFFTYVSLAPPPSRLSKVKWSAPYTCKGVYYTSTPVRGYISYWAWDFTFKNPSPKL